MTEAPQPRRRRPKRPLAYAILMAACALVALAAAWSATRAPAPSEPAQPDAAPRLAAA